jgi:hypothetical protein
MHHSRGVRCPHTQILALHALTTFISLSLLFNLLKDLTLYDINEENHSKNTKQPLDLNYICFFFSLTWVSGPACVHLD